MKSQKKTIMPSKCPDCGGDLEKYQDYSGDQWLGCNKCEEYEIPIKDEK